MMYAAYAPEAMAMAGVSRARVNAVRPCLSGSFWSHIALGTTTDQKHGQPRRTEDSP
ncbi:MAG: hypothetical protein ABWZ15_10305 [Acidimicrobiia bacterium]